VQTFLLLQPKIDGGTHKERNPGNHVGSFFNGQVWKQRSHIPIVILRAEVLITKTLHDKVINIIFHSFPYESNVQL